MDFLFPPICAGCGTFSFRFCPQCFRNVALFIHSNPCPRCGNKMTGRFCHYCSSNHFIIQSIKSWGMYQFSLRQAIIQLKFHRNLALGDTFSYYLKQVVLDSGWNFDLVVPVPISAKRKKERGYNQSAILAQPLALSLNKPYVPRALAKPKEVLSQIGLSFSQRMSNIQDCFRADSKIINGKSILVVDDITTTGATLNSCAQACLAAGASSVFGIALAKTPYRSERPDSFIFDPT